jgi:hypothetical protein
MTTPITPDVAGSPASPCWAASGQSAIPLSRSFQASREQWTEEDVCYFHLHMLRQQYEREAKPWIDRLVKIERMSVPSYVVSFPPNSVLSQPAAETELDSGVNTEAK